MSPTIPIGIPNQGSANMRISPTTMRAIATPSMQGSSPTALRLNGEDDEPLLGELAHGVLRALTRVARRLGPAVGHLVGAEGRGLVDGHAAELQLLRQP